MKKGMTIALLMVAMVALAASASAVAPVISNLPSVIIGDAGDISGSGTTALHLLRYENILDLSGAVVRENNPSTTTFMKVFYTVSNSDPAKAGTVKAGNSAAVATALTGSELTNLRAGTAPAAAKQINNPATDTAFSLINDAAGTVASISAATAAANGKDEATLTADGALNAQTLTLWATDYFMATDKVGSGTMVVYSVLGAEDSPSPADIIIVNEPNLGTATGHEGWNYNTQDPANHQGANANLQTIPSTTTATGFGFKGVASWTGTSKNQGYSSWEHTGNGVILCPTTEMDGKIFKAVMTVGGNATTPLLCPSYRILFMSTGFAHVGGFQVTTIGNDVDTATAMNMPSASNPTVQTRLYWGIPTTMNQYADGEKAATVGGTEDKRSYYMTFDVMQAEAGDIGIVTLNSVVIAKIVRPNGVTPAIAWGPGARAFDEAATKWSARSDDGGTLWGTGVATITSDAVAMSMTAIRKSVFCQVSPIADAAVGYPAWTSGKLLRVTYNLSASNVDTCPQIRMFVLPWALPLTSYKMGNTMWGEALDPSVWRGWYPQSSGLGLAGAPKPAGSTIETYAYMMNAPDSTEPCIMTPVVDIDQNNAITFPTNGWAKPNATVKILGCSMEVITVN